jgi:hypothetical protein
MSIRGASMVLGVAVLALPLPAGANGPPTGDPSCWGQASAAFAQSEPGALGEHASNPPPIDLNGPKPGRTGLGNIAQLFEAHVSDLPQLLGQPCP